MNNLISHIEDIKARLENQVLRQRCTDYLSYRVAVAQIDILRQVIELILEDVLHDED